MQAKKWTYYNEFDKKSAQWIRELIKKNLISDGEVDERDIKDVSASDIRGFRRVHWFAGVAGWELALQLAGWPEDKPVWTGSCPCQPFSSAGKGLAQADERHLWPVFFQLIRECRPSVVFGEQVAGAAVTGKRRDKDVFEMWDEFAFFKLLQEQERILPNGLPKLRELASRYCSEEDLLGEQNQEARTDSSIGGEIQGEQTRTTVQPFSRGYTDEDRKWTVRDDGDTIRSGKSKGMEHAVTRSDCSGQRIHDKQCEGSSIRSERDVFELGRAEDIGSIKCTNWNAETPIGRFIVENWAAAESEASAWLAGVRDDLESVGYTFGSSILSAAGVSAPHLRQRLYWGATRLAEDSASIGCGGRDNGDSARDIGKIQAQGLGDDVELADVQCDGHYGRDTDRRAESLCFEKGRVRQPSGLGDGVGLANCDSERCDGVGISNEQRKEDSKVMRSGEKYCPCCDDWYLETSWEWSEGMCPDCGKPVADCFSEGFQRRIPRGEDTERTDINRYAGCSGTVGLSSLSPWSDFGLVYCRDGKIRRVPAESLLLSVADGISEGMDEGRNCGVLEVERGFPLCKKEKEIGRTMLLKGYGNAVVPQVAAEFIRAFEEEVK